MSPSPPVPAAALPVWNVRMVSCVPRLTDGLCSDDADCLMTETRLPFARFAPRYRCELTSLDTAHENGANLGGSTPLSTIFGIGAGDHLVLGEHQLASLGSVQIVHQIASPQTLAIFSINSLPLHDS